MIGKADHTAESKDPYSLHNPKPTHRPNPNFLRASVVK